MTMTKAVPTTVLALLLFVLSVSSFLQPPVTTTRRRLSRSRISYQSESSSTTTESSLSTWQSHVSTHPEASSALTKLLDSLPESNPPDIAFLFVSQYHASQFPALVKQAAAQLTKKSSSCRLVSVVGGGVIGENTELDEPSKPSMSLLTGHSLPPNSFQLFDFNELSKPPPPVSDSDYWNTLHMKTKENDHGGSLTSSSSSFLLFADPWSPVEHVIAALGQRRHSDAVIAGGISVPTGVGPTVAIDDQPLPQGSLVGVGFQNALKLEVAVTQGCRPAGPSFAITAAEGSCILELDSQPALAVLEHFVSSIEDSQEQKAISSGLVCGIQAEYNDINKEEEEGGGDYLIRQILGFVPSKGGIAVAGGVHAGERLRFHVRDKQAAQEDLALTMKRASSERAVFGDQGKLVAAIQISCVARGRSLFGDPGVDLSQTKLLLDDGGPVAGFYANGEIGPVGLAGFSPTTDAERRSSGSGSHIHGFTTVSAYLCDMSTSVTNDDDDDDTPSRTPLIDEPAAWA